MHLNLELYIIKFWVLGIWILTCNCGSFFPIFELVHFVYIFVSAVEPQYSPHYTCYKHVHIFKERAEIHSWRMLICREMSFLELESNYNCLFGGVMYCRHKSLLVVWSVWDCHGYTIVLGSDWPIRRKMADFWHPPGPHLLWSVIFIGPAVLWYSDILVSDWWQFNIPNVFENLKWIRVKYFPTSHVIAIQSSLASLFKIVNDLKLCRKA